MARKKQEEIVINENISVESLDGLMANRYATYAKYVIQDRAIPDARDGLKPVQRRIIYSMWDNKNTFDRPTKKCAKIVGDVMGRFHPHGDTSIYDALVRMSQPWKMSSPLIAFQGNNGSIDDDPAAAYRYTEAKLNEFSNYLIKDIDKDTIDKTLNFDDSELEPLVLPARFPNLYVNGSQGIAVGIATEIPPHNLEEMCEAVIYRINHPRCELDELLEIVKGPDFPTGGKIYQSSGIRDIYATGRGKIEIVSKVEIKEEKDHNELIVTEIPYKVVKQQLVYSIDKIKKSKEVDGILDVRDLSSGDDIKIIIELKKESDPNVILTYLLNKTQLKVSYTSNIEAICHNHPRILTLTSYLDIYINHQVEVITRRCEFDLNKALSRVHIVEGLIKAINVIKEVIEIISKSKDKSDSKINLMKRFDFTDEQAEAIVMMRLYKISNTDINLYLDEKKELDSIINDLKETLSSPSKLRRIIVNDLKEIIKKFPTPRRTIITDEVAEIKQIDKRALIAKEDVQCVITKDGYIKRSSLKSLKASNGSLPGLKMGDSIVMNMMVSTLDYILAFTNKGNYLFIPVHEILENKWKDEGKHVNYMCNLPLEEIIIKCIVVKDFSKKVNIALVSKLGQIKKTTLENFYALRYNKPITCMKLLRNDEVVDVSVLNGKSNLLIIAKNGTATYFNENQFSDTGLKTSGVKSISTLRNTEVGGLISYRNDEKDKLIIFTDQGMYRIYDPSNLDLTDRLGRTQSIFKSFKSEPHNLVALSKIINRNEPFNLIALLNDDEIYETKIEDLHLTPIDKMCRKNLGFKDNAKIKNIFINDVQVIDESTIEEIPTIQEDVKIEESKETEKPRINLDELNNKEVEEDVNYEQISIFDDMGD